MSNYQFRKIFFLPFAFCFLFFVSCENDIRTIQLLMPIKNLPAETMKDAEIMYSDSGKVKMKLTGAQLDHFTGEDKDYIEFPKGVNVLFYDDSMHVNSKLKADYGIRYEKDGKMEAKRNVEVVNVKEEKLNTEYLIWDEKKDSIYTKAPVTITSKDYVMWGDGLKSNRDFTKYKITHPHGTRFVDEKDSIQ